MVFIHLSNKNHHVTNSAKLIKNRQQPAAYLSYNNKPEVLLENWKSLRQLNFTGNLKIFTK